MNSLNTSTTIPINKGSDGVIRIGSTRVTLETVVQVFQNGSTAEEIAFQYPVLDLSDIYAVISYYLKNQTAVDNYIKTSQTAAEEIKSAVQKQFESKGTRQRLMMRKSNRS